MAQLPKSFPVGIRLEPVSADPANPREGQLQRSDGTHRQQGVWEYRAGAWQQLAGASGGLNYIEDPTFEGGITFFDNESDDGDFGASAETSAPILGTISLKLTKASGADHSAKYIESDIFTIDEQFASSKFFVSFYHKENANYTDDSFKVELIDVENSATKAINPEGIKAGGKFYFGTVQTSAFGGGGTEGQYKLRFTVVDTGTDEMSMDIDNVRFAPVSEIASPSAAAIGDWKSFTPTGSWSANTTYSGLYKQVGDEAKIRYLVDLSGSPTSANLTLNLPSGLSADESKMFFDNDLGNSYLGEVYIRDNGTSRYVGKSFWVQSSDVIQVFFLDDAAAAIDVNSLNQSSPITFTNNDVIIVEVSIPIQGWSAGGDSQVAAVDAARPVEFEAYLTSDQSIANNSTSTMTWDSIDEDSHGMFLSNTVVIPRTDTYTIALKVGWNASATGVRGAGLRVNSSTFIAYDEIPASDNFRNSNSVTITKKLTKGDIVDVRVYQNSGGALNIEGTDASYTYWTIYSSGSNSALIDAQANVNAFVSGDAPNATAGNPFIFPTVDFDTNGFYNSTTGEFTPDHAMKVRVSAALQTATANTSIFSYIDGVSHKLAGTTDGNGNANFCTIVSLQAGEALTIRPSGGAMNPAGNSNMSFEKID